jgi:hypothetical protein
MSIADLSLFLHLPFYLTPLPYFRSTEVFNDTFLDKLFDLVEQTRNMQDETFNYSVIKLIVGIPFHLPLFAV